MATVGFLLDPEISMFHPFSGDEANAVNGPTSTVARQGSLNRTRSITQRIHSLRRNVLRPFTLSARPPMTPFTSQPPQPPPPPSSIPTPQNGHRRYPDGSITGRLKNAAHEIHQTIREPNTPTFLSRAMRSDNTRDELKLPFRLSIDHLHDKTTRNVPYLRQSWNRIDFIAIVSFWVMFGLAIAGIERGKYHVGIFRALSVIRTARLLAITSGTTVRHFLLVHLSDRWPPLDYHALVENRAPATRQCCILCSLRHGTILVSIPIACCDPCWLWVALLASNRSMARYDGLASSSPHWGRMRFSWTVNSAVVTSTLWL